MLHPSPIFLLRHRLWDLCRLLKISDHLLKFKRYLGLTPCSPFNFMIIFLRNLHKDPQADFFVDENNVALAVMVDDDIPPRFVTCLLIVSSGYRCTWESVSDEIRQSLSNFFFGRTTSLTIILSRIAALVILITF
jgi:hypothetical protein